MRYVRMFLLFFQDVNVQRARSFVWFLLSLLNPFLLLIFWTGVYTQTHLTLQGWSLSTISSYYLLLIIASAFLDVHIEETVAILDIREGGLVKYLTRPFSYFWLAFISELPWRVFQGGLGVLIFFFFALFFTSLVQLTRDPFILILSLLIIVSAYMLSFVFKMILGLSAFWVTDFWGLQQLVEVAALSFAGFLMPLEFYPKLLEQVAYILPFSYIIYFPVIAIQGKLSVLQLFQVLGTQALWICALTICYKYLWRKGIQKFVGVGQ